MVALMNKSYEVVASWHSLCGYPLTLMYTIRYTIIYFLVVRFMKTKGCEGIPLHDPEGKGLSIV